MGDAVGEYILFPHGVFLWPDSGLTQNFEEEKGIAVSEGQVKWFNEKKGSGFIEQGGGSPIKINGAQKYGFL